MKKAPRSQQISATSFKKRNRIARRAGSALLAATFLSAFSAHGANYATTDADPVFNVGYGTAGNLTLLTGDTLTLAPEETNHSLNVGRNDGGGNGGNGTLLLQGGLIEIDDSGADAGVYGVINIGRGHATTGNVFHQGGEVLVSNGAFQIGVEGGMGLYEFESGSVELGSKATVYIGDGSYEDDGLVRGDGTLAISGTASFTRGTVGAPVTGGFFIGTEQGTGRITQDGADSTVSLVGGNLQFGVDSDSTGSYELSAGSLTMQGSGVGVVFGKEGTGVFDIEGGTATVHGKILLADGADSTGTIHLTGTGVLEIGGTDAISAGEGTASFHFGGGTLKAINSDLGVSIAPELEEGTTSTFDSNGSNIILTDGFTGGGGFVKTGAGALVLGDSSELAGSSSVEQGDLVVGGPGAATGELTLATDLTVEGGSNLVVGRGVGHSGTLHVGAGAAVTLDNTNGSTNNFDVGDNGGTGVVNMTGGAVDLKTTGGSGYNRLRIGSGNGSTGAFNQSGGVVDTDVGSFSIGLEGGTGAYNLSNDAQLRSGNVVHVGRGLRTTGTPTTTGTLTLTGNSSFELIQKEGLTESWLYLGRWYSEGTVHQQDNSEVTLEVAGLILGTNNGGTGTGTAEGHYLLEDGTLTVNASYVRLGETAGTTGTFTQSDGTSSFDSFPGSTQKNAVVVGDGGVGTFTVEGGKSTLHNGMVLANAAGSTGTLNLRGNGILEVGGTDGLRKGAGTAQVNLEGGTLSAVGGDLTSSLDMTLKEETTTTIRTDEADASLSGILSGAGNLKKEGEGALTLAGVNTYTGTTDITAGTLIVAGTGTTGSGAVTIGADATLAGTGLVKGAATVHGALNPGNSPGNLAFAQGLTLAAGSVTTLEIAGSGAGQYDTLSVESGVFTLGGILKLELTQSFNDAFNANLFLLDDATFAGNFSEVLLTGVYGDNNSFDQDGTLWTLDLGGRAFTFDASTGAFDVAAIPEPSAWALLISGAAGLWMLRRRRIAV
ncbi:MAG TPA: autotransporter-associated beta strand repeat-containing protein [Chthoniobacteraceae bacterium]|nr:autotransporter-associated beta strand repeat-containing protein [Chthoniobacteraceae bacterium]